MFKGRVRFERKVQSKVEFEHEIVSFVVKFWHVRIKFVFIEKESARKTNFASTPMLTFIKLLKNIFRSASGLG